jgi:O-antigen/teichoic acid export membrane protein
MVCLVLLVGRPLLALFGPSFVEGYSVLFILSVGLLLRASIGPAETLLIMASQQGITAAIYTVTFALNVALNLLLIPHFGIDGAATATTLALGAETFALYVIVLSRLGINCSILSALKAPASAPAEAG